jgi:NAD(P)H-dependent FMN reductase
MSQKLVMIIGSPRLKHSTSYAIADYLKNGLSKQGWTVDILFAHQAITNETTMEELLIKTDQTDIIGIIFPLYVDSIPGPLIQVLETMSEHMTKKTDQKIFTIVNSGFPEPHQSQLAVDMIENFSKECQDTFIGGLTIGAGGVIGGKPIEQIKHRSKRLMTALHLTIQDLVETQTISERAVQILSKPIFPKILYNIFANISWAKRSKKYGSPDLYQRPDKLNNGY